VKELREVQDFGRDKIYRNLIQRR